MAKEKRVAIVVPAADGTALEHMVLITPGITAGRLLDSPDLQLAGYRLSKGVGQPFIGDQDPLFGVVEEDDRLYATPVAQQG